MFDRLRQLIKASDRHNSIVVVVSPLSALMQDQVKSFQSKGIKAAFIGEDQTDETIKSGVISGEYSLVYMSPVKPEVSNQQCQLGVSGYR